MPCMCVDCVRFRGEDPEPHYYCVGCGEVRVEREGELCEDCFDREQRDSDQPTESEGGERQPFLGRPSKRYPRFLGVEIECGVPRWTRVSPVMEKWGVRLHEDGSVRVDGHSNELVTAPARGQAFEDQINELAEALATDGAKVNKSCGLHVHVDVRDLNGAQILAVVRLYSRIEKTLYGLVAKSRRSNSFSAPWGTKLAQGDVLDASKPVAARTKALDVNVYGSEAEAETVKRYREKHGSRYHGLNVNAIVVHGTLEFRLHHGTVDGRKIKMWAALCTAIVEYAVHRTEQEIIDLRGTPAEILGAVLADDRELLAWTRARRRFFDEQERKRRGLPPRAATRAPRVAAPLPAVEPGPLESGEVTGDEGRVGRRAYR